jgi:dolichol kinase
LALNFAFGGKSRAAKFDKYVVELLSILGTCVTLSYPLRSNSFESTQNYIGALQLAIALTVFNLICTFIFKYLYKSFSIGETMIVGQIVTLFVVDFLHFVYAKQRHTLYFILGISSNATSALVFAPLPSARNETMIFIQYIIACVLWVGATSSAAMCFLAKRLDRRRAVTMFYSLLAVQFSVWVYFSKFVFHEEGVNIITWLVSFVFVESMEPFQLKRVNILIISYWFVILMVGLYAVSRHGDYLSNNIKIIKRKLFHILAVLLFVPVAYVNIELLNVALGVALSIFILVEFVRLNDTYSFIGLEIEKYLKEHTDERDDGQVILTHMYLLAGCAIPLWIGSMTLFHHDKKQIAHAPTDTGVIYLCLLSGVVSVGIGDAMGSIVGKLCDTRNKIKWPNTNKSVQGTLGMATSIFLSNTFLYLYSNIIFATFESGGRTTGSHRYDMYDKKGLLEIALPLTYVSVAVSLLEACTLQIDNLVLPLFLYSLTRLTRW